MVTPFLRRHHTSSTFFKQPHPTILLLLLNKEQPLSLLLCRFGCLSPFSYLKTKTLLHLYTPLSSKQQTQRHSLQESTATAPPSLAFLSFVHPFDKKNSAPPNSHKFRQANNFPPLSFPVLLLLLLATYYDRL